jgi:hypothetical protein
VVHTLAVAPEADDALALLVHGDCGEVHCVRLVQKNRVRGRSILVAMWL